MLRAAEKGRQAGGRGSAVAKPLDHKAKRGYPLAKLWFLKSIVLALTV